MTPLVPIPAPLNDAELLRVVTSPRQRLFPSLYRASAFAPLILVCCVVPTVLVLAHHGLNEESSLWGLRSLAFANATTLQAMWQPGLNEAGEPLLYQPPLAAWLNGLVAGLLEPTHPLATSLVSLMATGIAIWIVTRCAWRIGGAHTALIAALLMCSHPQVLDAAIVPTNSAVGMSLLLATFFGFQRHLQRGASLVSLSLLTSGMTWGLSLLAIGPVAFSLPLIFTVHSLRYATPHSSEIESAQSSKHERWPAIRSTLLFTIIGLAVGGWWEVMMASQHASAFLCSWWSSLPSECLNTKADSEWKMDLCPVLQQSSRDWLRQNALLLAWLVVGWIRAWHECRCSRDVPARRRYQLLLYWWTFTIVARILVELAGHYTMTNTAVWNVALVAPSILLASLGFGSLIERAIFPAGEFILIVSVIGLTVYSLTADSLTAWISASLVIPILIYGPRLISTPDGNPQQWTETSWRGLLKLTVYGSLAASLFIGFRTREPESSDEHRVADLKVRIESLPEVRRISLIASRDPIPVGLKYVLRCRWPSAEIVTSEGWDEGLTREMESENQAPTSRFLVLEWTRRNIRISANTGQAWQVSAVGNPMRFYGRRLSLVLIEPKT